MKYSPQTGPTPDFSAFVNMSDSVASFRNLLARALAHGHLERFDFSAWVAEHRVPANEARLAATQVLSHVCRRAVRDGIVTDREAIQIQVLADLLKLEREQPEILLRAKQEAYSEAVRQARSEGIVTQEEQANLDRLHRHLGLAPADPPRDKQEEVRGIDEPATERLSIGQFDQSRLYRARKLSDAVVQDLAGIRHFDKKSEAKFGGIYAIAVACGLTMFASFVAGFVLTMNGVTYGPCFFLLTVLAIGVMVLLHRKGVLWMRRNLIDCHYTLPWRLLLNLKDTLDPNQPLDVTIDLASYHDPKFLVRATGQPPPPMGKIGIVRDGDDSFAQHEMPWLHLTASCRDGARLRITSTMLVRRRMRYTRPRRNVDWWDVVEEFRERIGVNIGVAERIHPTALLGILKRQDLLKHFEIERTQIDGKQLDVIVVTRGMRRERKVPHADPRQGQDDDVHSADAAQVANLIRVLHRISASPREESCGSDP